MIRRLRAAGGIALAQLAHYRVRTLLSIVAIALAVLSMTLLGSVGVGVLETGAETFDASGRDLWITGGPMQLSPGVGGFENRITGAHAMQDEIQAIPGVETAVPMAFGTVYAGTDPFGLESVVGVGVPGAGGSSVTISNGSGFTRGDVHYADGSYGGPMTHEAIIDERTAAMFDLAVNDSLYVGGTLANARANEFTVVGVSPTFSRFLGTPTVTVPLSEFQEITGATGSDRATLLTVSVESGASVDGVATRIANMYPEYEVRTNREQLSTIVGRQALVLASAGTLVLLSIVAGLALTANALALVVYQQRAELSAVLASGVSSGTLMLVVAIQALLLGTIGGGIGVILTGPFGMGLEYVAATVVGFDDLVRTPLVVLAVGFVLALGMALLEALFAAWHVSRIGPLDGLEP